MVVTSPRLHRGPRPLPLALRQELGAGVRRARKTRHLTLEALAEKCGMSSGTIGMLERGEMQDPPLGTVLRVMHALDLDSIEQMLGSTGFPSAALAALL